MALADSFGPLTEDEVRVLVTALVVYREMGIDPAGELVEGIRRLAKKNEAARDRSEDVLGSLGIRWD